MITAGVLVRDAQALLLRLSPDLARAPRDRLRGDRVDCGLRQSRIRKHELTTPAKEDDRVRQIEAVDAQTGPVMLAYPAAPEIDARSRAPPA